MNGHGPDPGVLRAIAEEALRTRGLRPAFPAEVLAQAQAETARPPSRAGAPIRDLRMLDWFSIDNDDTRDLDQLSVLLPDEGGTARLLVAVADVDCRVPQGSPMDAHAAANTTSVYTAAGVFPMLPEVLSTGLTSLHEGEDRLAVVVELHLQADGEIRASTLYRAEVCNRAQLTYNAVSAWLDGQGPVPPKIAAHAALQAQVRRHDEIASALRSRRQQRGALNVKTISVRPVFEDGVLVDFRPDEKNRAKDLIADLMIAANAATARFLADAGAPSLRRFLQAPQRWDRIVALAASHGSVLPASPDPVALDDFLRARRTADPDAFADLSLAIVKLLGSGEYAAAPAGGAAAGHFGLAVNDYAHSTAPNRRYPDLVTQRLVKAVLAGETAPYTPEELGAIARHCTVQEDNASKAERQVMKSAATWLLQHRIGETFDAIVTGAAPKGTFVRLQQPMVEGCVVRGFEGMDVGDAVRVTLVSVDATQGHLDFAGSNPSNRSG